MNEAIPFPVENPGKFQLSWIPEVVFFPRQALKKVAVQTRSIWLTPILLLSLTALILVLVSGPVKLAQLQSQGPTLPPDFQYYSPEMQAQFMQASQATQSPVFLYVFPALLALGQVWFGFLLVGGFLHLVLTLNGGRGDTTTAMNLVAWAALPFAIRDLVRVIAIQSTHQLIANPGLSGFASSGEGVFVFIGKLLGLVDVYILWHILLLVLGVRLANGLALGKTWLSVLITVLVALGLEALLLYLSTILGGMETIRPFFF